MLCITPTTVTKKPVAGESTKETVKPLRREGRTASAEPVCSCAFSFVQLAHETAGAACTRSSLLSLEGEGYLQNSGASGREIAKPRPSSRLLFDR
jgi:hypothetical protein